MIPPEVARVLRKQKYRIVGNHSGVKICLWTKKSLTEGKVCYKQKWYGIESHRCMEFSPSLIWCTHHCLFCWRIQSGDRGLVWKEFPFDSEIDDPKEIIDEAIKARKELLSGFGGYVDRKKWEEALIPTNVAISLAGEPTLYPRLSELIEECHRRGMKTFLVTNGTMPEVLESLDPLPWQLYITLPAPSKEIYLKTCRPLLEDGWERIMRSLEIMKELKTRRVIRLTLVKGLNFLKPEEYAKLILKAEPDFVEPKSYMCVGESQKRLTHANMVPMEELEKFSEKLAEETGYKIEDRDEASRVFLLCKR